MKAIKIELKTVNPVIISKNNNDSNIISTRNYIPGSVILGVFARKYIEKNNIKIDAHKDKYFNKYFLGNEIIFSNLYVKDDNFDYFPTPCSVRKEKNDDYKIYDLLFQNDDFSKQTKNILEFSILKGESIYTKNLGKGISFHHARNRKTGTSQKGIIFNYEYIKKNQYFAGDIIGDDNLINDFFSRFQESFNAYIGKSKTSQYGKVHIKLSEPIKYSGGIHNGIDKSDDSVITMTFLSDAIIKNKNGFSTTNIRDIEELLGVKIKKAFIRQDRNEQFVGIWKLKRQSEIIATAGSCFLLEKLPNNYEELQRNGIGERRNEGFGRIVFGYQEHEAMKRFQQKQILYEQPKNAPCLFVKNLIKNIVKEKLITKTKNKALENAKDFTRRGNLPTKSLLSKLQMMSRNIGTFKSNFEKVSKRDITREQLLKSNNGRMNLLDFIFETIKTTNMISLTADEYNLLKEVSIDKSEIVNDDDFQNHLKQDYFETFFNFLRKA